MSTTLENPDLTFSTLDVLKELTRGNFFWQKRILNDKDLVESILSLEHDFHNEKTFWNLLFNISQHKGFTLSLYCFFLIIVNRSKASASITGRKASASIKGPFADSIRYCTNWNQVAQSLSMYRYLRPSLQRREYR